MFAGEPLSYRSKDVESQSSEYRVLFKIGEYRFAIFWLKAFERILTCKKVASLNQLLRMSGLDLILDHFQDSPLSLGNVFVLETAFKYFYHFQFNWGWQALL